VTLTVRAHLRRRTAFAAQIEGLVAADVELAAAEMRQ